MGHLIDKQFDFCYGHRVWNQTLDPEFAEDTCLKCRHLHGHQGKIHVYLELIEDTDTLVNGMVTDFKHLGWFKRWVDDVLDHKFIMDIDDPVRTTMFPKAASFDKLTVFDQYGQTYYKPAFHSISFRSAEEKEIYEGLIFVEFVPTSENLSKWFCEIVNVKMKPLGVRCPVVEFNETPKSKATYLL